MLARATSSSPNHAEDLSGATIAACAQTCHDCFHDSFDHLHDYQDGGSKWSTLRDLIGRFNIWASNMGVFATQHASLDYRLRDLADVKELKLEHLRNMKDRLDQLYHLLDRSKKTSVDSAKDTDYEPREESGEQEEIDSILNSISASIDWLHRLANMVRRASTLRQNVKASTFVLKDEQGDDATPVLKEIFRHWIKRDFPNIAHEFCERLIFTMLLRRRRILYRRSRQTKLALRNVEPVQKPTHLAPPPTSAGVEEKPPELPEAPLSPLPPVLAPSAVASTTQTATTVEPQAYFKIKSTPSGISGAKTISMTRNEKDMIPPPPRLADNALEFICPFCSLILPAKDARDRGRRDIWAAHVKKDLEPYVCHFFPCARGEDIFSTSTDWISHMQQTHCMRWRCTIKTHRPETFVSMEDYTAHMTAQHPGKFEEAQLPFLAANSQRPSRKIFKSCPLCGEDDIGNGEGLEDHVAHHLQYLALLSLPLPEDLHDAKGAASTSSTDSQLWQEDGEVASSRTTNKSELHLMEPATFPEGGDYPWEMFRPEDDETPDVDEQKQMEISQSWQLIRAGKFGLESMDQPITEEERRSDKTLAPFVLRVDSTPTRTRKQKIPDVRTWLSPLYHDIDQQIARIARWGRTADHWFLHDKLFTEWKVKPASFLYLTGPPRCGKTLLSSAIIDSLQQEASDVEGSSYALLYFYFDRYQSQKDAASSILVPDESDVHPRAPRFRRRRRDFGDMIRSLVAQLYDGCKQTRHIFEELCSFGHNWSMPPNTALLCSTFEEMILAAGQIWVVLESLHDCGDGELDAALALFGWLSVIHSRHENVHLLVTSLPDEEVRSMIEGDGTYPSNLLPIDRLQSLLPDISVYQELRRHPDFTDKADEDLFSSASTTCDDKSSA